MRIHACLRKGPPCREVIVQDDEPKGVEVLAEAQKIEVAVVGNDHVDNQMEFEVESTMSSEFVGIESEFVEGHYEEVVVSYQTIVPQVCYDQKKILVEGENVGKYFVHWNKVGLHYDIVKGCGFVEVEWENEREAIYKLMHEDQEYLSMIAVNLESWEYLVLD